jgi:hypothetical protein
LTIVKSKTKNLKQKDAVKYNILKQKQKCYYKKKQQIKLKLNEIKMKIE